MMILSYAVQKNASAYNTAVTELVMRSTSDDEIIEGIRSIMEEYWFNVNF